MATGTYAPNAALQFFTNAGAVLNGGLLYFYAAGTSTPLDTYSDVALATPNTNPVVLDSAGRAGAIFFSATSYKMVVKTSAGVTLVTRDNIAAVPTDVKNVEVDGTAGQAFSAREVGFLGEGGSFAVGQWWKTDADAAASSSSPLVIGMAISAIALGAVGVFRREGRVTGFTGLTAGAAYYTSSTPGAITILAGGTYQRFVGVADSATSLVLAPFAFPNGQLFFPTTQVASGNPDVLDDYKERDWTPVDGSAGATLTFTITGTPTYVKIGKLVNAHARLTYPVTANGSVAAVLLPLNAAVDSSPAVTIGYTTRGTPITAYVSSSDDTIVFADASTGVLQTNAQMSGVELRLSVSYVVQV